MLATMFMKKLNNTPLLMSCYKQAKIYSSSACEMPQPRRIHLCVLVNSLPVNCARLATCVPIIVMRNSVGCFRRQSTRHLDKDNVHSSLPKTLQRLSSSTTWMDYLCQR